MQHQAIDTVQGATPQHRLTYPLHQIVAAIARSDTDKVVTLLGDAGFPRDRIEVIVAEDVPRLEEPVGGSGIHRFLVRLQLSMGDDLDQLERARRELMNGHALVEVLVHGHQEQERVGAILSQHGGHAIHYFGRWTITPIGTS